jgi:crossover junction endodeoxyribonuclease RuvC
MRILGIDPGIGRVGWGFLEKNGNKIMPLVYDCFETQVNGDKPKRLQAIFEFMTEILEKYNPDALAIEDLFFNTNAKTALSVGEARGVVLLTAAQKEIPISVYTPLQVKIAVTGYGRAEKSQVGHMVKTLLKLPTIPKPDDTADALAIALTHAFTIKTSTP